MKKRQIILTALTVVMATLGVFANSMRATKYYRSKFPASWGYASIDCFIQITSPPCVENPWGTQCQGTFSWIPPAPGSDPVNDSFWISKTVDFGDCDAVRRLP